MQIGVSFGRDDDGSRVVHLEVRIDGSDTAALAALAEYEARTAAGTSPALTADPARSVAIPLLAAIVEASD